MPRPPTRTTARCCAVACVPCGLPNPRLLAAAVGPSCWVPCCWPVGGAAGGYGYAAWTREKTPEPVAASKPGAQTPQPVVSQSTATSDLVLESKGYIIPAKQVLVSPKVSGMLMTLNIAEGQRVAQGDVLAVLEDTDYQADYARAVAASGGCHAAAQGVAGLSSRGNRPGPRRVVGSPSTAGAIPGRLETSRHACRRPRPCRPKCATRRKAA